MSRIAAALTRVLNERAQSIVLRRGETTLAAQSFRVERVSKANQYRDEASRERRSDVVILGAVEADIAIGDRFNADGGLLYQVNFIQPNRTFATLAEAVVVK
jgi:hypothetical protein